MSYFSCDVVTIKGFGDHPNADRLSITQVYDSPVIFGKGQFKKGDQAVYIPVDSMVDVERPEFAFLKQKDGRRYERIKAKRLRGIYSEGLLIPVPANVAWQDGYDAKDELGVVKYEEKTHGTIFAGEQAADPGFMPKFDVEPYLKNKNALVIGEEVNVTEKLHGTNARIGVKDGVVHVGSHNTFLRFDPNNLYWKTFFELGLDKKLLTYPELSGIGIYGEIYGWVQDLRYDAKPGQAWFRVFAAYNGNPGAHRWLDLHELENICNALGLEMVPSLYRGPYSHEAIEALRNGKSTVGSHMREGFVVVPVKERYDIRVGRVAFKYVGEEYKLRKDGTEFH